MRRFLTRLVQVRSGEERLALLGAGFFLLVQSAQVFAINAGDTLLFDRFGVEILPRLFILLGAATLVTTTAYAAVLGRPDRARLSVWILAGLGLAAVVGWAVTFSSNVAVYPWLWLGVSLVNALIGTLVWVLAGEVCDARQAKRLFAVFASAGILGSVLAGFLTGPLAHAAGTQTLLIAAAALILSSVAVGSALSRSYARPAGRRSRDGSPIADLRQAHRLVFSNPTMRLTAMAAVIFSVLFFSVSYPFNVEVAKTFPDEANLAGFLGVFGGVVTGATFVVSLFFASRVYARIGVIGALLLLPLAYLAGFALWSIRLDLTTAVMFRFVQLVLLGGIAGTAFSALFNVVPADHRAQVRAYQSGPPAQLGVVLSGVLLLLGQQGLRLSQTLALGLVFSAVCVVLIWRMRRSYGASLVAALRQGITEVFTSSNSPFQAIRRDSQSVRVAVRALADPRPSIRRLSLTLLGELEAVEAVEAIAARRSDSAQEVRVAAVESLSRIPSHSAGEAARSFLSDPDQDVRSAAVAASHPSAAALETMAGDASPRVRAQVAVAFNESGNGARALGILADLLAGPDIEARLAGLRVCSEVEGIAASPTLVSALKNSPRPMRLEAARALRRAPSAEARTALVGALDDPDAGVRRAAGQALRAIGEVDGLLPVLDGGSSRAQEEVIAALANRPGIARIAVLDWAAREMAEAEQLRGWESSLSALPPSLALSGLRTILTQAEDKVEQRVLHGLGSAGSADAMHTVARALRSRDRELRSQAVEALESIGDRRVSRSLVRLLEADAAPATLEAAGLALTDLSLHRRPWFRALAFRARAEQNRGARAEIGRQAADDPSPIVRQALPNSERTTSGDPTMETGQTLGIVERVLFLRDVPIFRRLEPEDLEPIAGLAGERLHPTGEYLCREGDLGDELFVVVEGAVEVSKQAEGAPHVLRTLHSGEHLGELAILREQPRSATVRALTDTRTLVLSGDALRTILEDRPQVSLAMLASLAERMSSLT
jgi:HEAT repeat protein